MNIDYFFTIVKAANFFPEYASQVMNWKGKMRGCNTRKAPLEFSAADLLAIQEGIKAFAGAAAVKLVEELAGAKK